MLTKLREFFAAWLRVVRGGRKRPPPEPETGAGVGAKLPRPVPTLSGANARAFPPEE